MLSYSYLSRLKNGACQSAIFWHFDVCLPSSKFEFSGKLISYYLRSIKPSSSFLLANDWKKWGRIQEKSGLVRVSGGFEFAGFELAGFNGSGSILLLTIYDGGPGKFKVAIRPLFGKRLKKLIAQIACYTKY